VIVSQRDRQEAMWLASAVLTACFRVCVGNRVAKVAVTSHVLYVDSSVLTGRPFSGMYLRHPVLVTR